uniref:Rne/Rng family ribonuclease n=1 Tax=Hydrogenobacter sp. TaxID=2152829 RepID=A0A7C2ZFI6_9AQUI
MAKRLVVLSASELILSFLIEGNNVYKISAEERGFKRYTDSIFKGKVKRLAKGMDGVFVDVGIGRDAFLPLKGENYRVGESLIVQMVREPEGEKGAKLTTNVKLVGKYLVYFPRGKDIRCSSRIQSEEKDRLCSLLEKDLKEEGVILRSAAVRATHEQIKEELEKLRGLWQQIERRAKALKKPQPILEEYPSYIRLIRDHWQDMEEIISDNPLIWNHIASFLEDFEPELLKKNLYIKDPTAYVHKYKLQDSLRSVLNKVVWLKGGGYISIEETEAFTIIDVNSGDPTGSCHEENALRTNLEAVKEIAKQVILRDIGGIILIDFIDMKKQENKELVIKSMQQAFEEETCNITIYGFTKLGILEMSRKKSGRSISKLLTEACPYCSGKGYIKSSSFFLFELEKEITDQAHKALKVQVHPIRYEKVKKALQSKGYSHIQVDESHDVGVNNFNISHG